MAIVLKDRVKETTSTTGTSDFVLGGSSSGYQAFSVIGANSYTYYCAYDQATGDWEVGYGQYTTTAGGTLVRNTILSNSAATTSKIAFAAGPKDVFITYPAEKAIYEEASGNVLIDGGPITVIGQGVTGYTTFNAALSEMYGDVNTFAQSYARNLNDGSEASADMIVYRDNTLTDSANFMDMGINSSNFSSATWPIFTPSSMYLYGDGGEMFIGSGTDDVVFFAGGVDTTDEAMRIDKTTKALTTVGDVNVGGALDVTGAATFGSTVLLNADPTLNLQAATKQYVDQAVSTGLHLHQPVQVATTGNLTATYNNGTAGVGATLTNSGTQVALSIDDISMSVNARVLVWQQSTPAQNGVYVVTTVGSGSTNWVLTRSADADNYNPQSDTGLGGGDYFYVQEGTLGAGDSYVCTNDGVIVFGTTAITFAQFSGAITYVGGTNIDVTGQTISLTGTVAATNGGTGASTVTTGDLLYGSGANTWGKLAAGAAYRSLVMNAGGTNVEWNAVALNQSGAVSGALPATNGGTGQNAYATGDMLYSDATNSIAKLSGNTTTTKKFLGQTGTGTGSAAPVWQQPAATDITGLAASATTDTTNASNISSGTLPSGRLSGSYTGITGVGTLTAGTWNGSTVGPTYGGTGLASYTVGDLLYADTSTSLAKLADVAVGNALISGGVGSAPSWGKIGAATHISGVLPTANGGTNLSSFTANGVMYASSTSALTTGTALQFDGTNLGVGVTPSASTLPTIQSTYGVLSGNTNINIMNNAYYSGGWKYTAGGTVTAAQYQQDTGRHIWYSAGAAATHSAGDAITFTQAMTLDASGNLGVGITSPSAKLDVYQATQVNSTFRAYGPAGQILWANGGASTSYLDSDTIIFRKSSNSSNTETMRIDSSGNLTIGGQTATRLEVNLTENDKVELNAVDSTNTARNLVFSTGDTERARIDSSGNLGLGVTPNTWASTAKAFELYGGGSIYANASSNDLRIGCNVYISSAGNNTYKTTNAASLYYQAGGTHYWYNAPSGTAGTTATFTQAMTLDANGNLGIGRTATAVSSYRMLELGGVSGGYIRHYVNGTVTGYWYTGASSAGIGTNTAIPFIFSTNDLERARFDSSGNFLIGQTGTASALLTLGSSTSGQGIGWGPSSANYANIWAAYSSGDLVLGANVYGSTASDVFWSSYGGAALARAAVRVGGAGTIKFHTAAATSTARGSAVTVPEIARFDAGGNFGSLYQIRATGWWNSAGSTYSGLGTEIGISAGEGYVLCYNRDTSTYGALNLNSSGANLRISGSTVNVNTGALQQGGSQVLTAANVSSYALPISGGTLTGALTLNAAGITSPNGNTVVAADSAMPTAGNSLVYTLGLGPSSNDGHIIGMTWTTASVYGAQIWLDTDPTSRMAVRSRGSTGVWNTWAEVLTSLNYTSYSPSLTGSGASGSWGISVTGTAGSLSSQSGSAPSYAKRAWVNFNGTGTVAIRASGNVSSITDNGTGLYTVNFSTAMQDANYAVTGMCDDAGYAYASTVALRSLATSSVAIRSNDYNSTQDRTYINITVIR